MQKLIIFILSLSLVGCASSRMPRESNPKISGSHPIAPKIKFDFTKVWPLNKGTYLQKITASVKGKKYSFTVHLTLENEMLEAIAINDIAGRLYSLKWTPNDMIWDKSARIPDFIKPENIIADFLFVHLPANQLQCALKGSQVFERPTQLGLTRVIKINEVLRTITYETPSGNMWKHVIIENPVLGYQLNIQTVIQ